MAKNSEELKQKVKTKKEKIKIKTAAVKKGNKTGGRESKTKLPRGNVKQT